MTLGLTFDFLIFSAPG